MKKIKIVMAAIIVLSTAGGVLAYKLNEARFIRICTLGEPQSGQPCPMMPCNDAPAIAVKFVASGPPICYYSLPSPSINCRDLICKLKGTTAVE